MADSRQGLFLDLDGTLADSLSVLREVYVKFLGRFGVKARDEEFEILNGLTLIDIIDVLKERHNLAGSSIDLRADYVSSLAEVHRLSPPTRDAQRVLQAACDLGWTVAVVTSGPRTMAATWLAQHGLSKYVGQLVAGDDIGHGKPAPDPYLLALSRTDCTAERSLAVEDSLSGAVSATAAMLRTFVLMCSGDRRGWPANVTFINRLTDLLPVLHGDAGGVRAS